MIAIEYKKDEIECLHDRITDYILPNNDFITISRRCNKCKCVIDIKQIKEDITEQISRIIGTC